VNAYTLAAIDFKSVDVKKYLDININQVYLDFERKDKDFARFDRLKTKKCDRSDFKNDQEYSEFLKQ